ncbi:outer membrane transport energization protein TonB [Rhodobacter viridis]|uniref:Outer membrane transport energization protein TonB n=1 Tax=Rhodobacter viridis TaxID=1054202 RepID=A0A318U133_9RHOB|nr:TonB family protein [Rhodobacter viridis]PYF11849.1 outer membrane transport energization protein TonB [Rhodobacter viridis]
MSLALSERPEGPGRALLLGLAVSVAVHAVAVTVLSQTEAAPSALVAAGAGGEDLDSIEAIAAAFFDLAPAIRLPAPEMALPLTAPLIEVPQVKLPDPVLLPPAPPKVTLEKPKPAPPKPKPVPREKAEKPKQAKPARHQSDSRAASRAAGSGGAVQAGTGGQDAQATVSAGAVKSQLLKWGATIRTRIERRKSYPSAAGRASGGVGLALSIARDGTLQSASVNRSSGNAALDAAALAAVQKAGKFPAAPTELTKPSYAFSVAVKFSR